MRNAKFKLQVMLLIIIAFAFVCQSISAKTLNDIDHNYLIKPIIAYVIDGDTVKIRLKERNVSVRLNRH